ncbi:MAG: hypothetical protein AB1427_13040 [Thermodesulfobacteriota bacterium]
MDMPLDVRVSVANLEEDDVRILELTLGKYVNTGLMGLKALVPSRRQQTPIHQMKSKK